VCGVVMADRAKGNMTVATDCNYKARIPFQPVPLRGARCGKRQEEPSAAYRYR
jgi:hypothetical protein